MRTAQKIALARIAYRILRSTRALAGKPDRVVVRRAGISYDLDISQGIDFAIYLGNLFERRTQLALRQLVTPSSLVLDVGANIGAHTLLLAQLVGPRGQVLAFEPTDFAFAKLERNLKLNPDLQQRIVALQCFLDERDENYVPPAIYSAWPLIKERGLHSKHLGRHETTTGAQARSLDSVLAQFSDRTVALVKLDVDGFECSVLRGATTMLREAHPIFVMELAPYALRENSVSLDELLSYFIPYGYQLFDEHTRHRLPSNAISLQRMLSDGESMNVVAKPP